MMNELKVQKSIEDMSKELILLVDELSECVDLSRVFTRDRLGKNQVRQMVTACQQANCIEELKGLLAYKVGKDGAKEGWGFLLDNGLNMGAKVLQTLSIIDNKVEQFSSDDKAKLQAYAKFFGYFYWKIVAKEGEMK